MKELFLFQTATQTLRGERDAAAAQLKEANTGYYYAGRLADQMYVSGLSRALAVLDGLAYEHIQCEIETRLP